MEKFNHIEFLNVDLHPVIYDYAVYIYIYILQYSTAAWTGVFNGTVNFEMTFVPPHVFHTNDISLRFKTVAKDGVLFQTRSLKDRSFLRIELLEGVIHVTTNLGGQYQVKLGSLYIHFMD